MPNPQLLHQGPIDWPGLVSITSVNFDTCGAFLVFISEQAQSYSHSPTYAVGCDLEIHLSIEAMNFSLKIAHILISIHTNPHLNKFNKWSGLITTPQTVAEFGQWYKPGLLTIYIDMVSKATGNISL